MNETRSNPAAPRVRCYKRLHYGAEECFANMALLWRHYGRPPRSNEANMPPSKIGKSAYILRCGNWTRAVEAFAAFSGINMNPAASAISLWTKGSGAVPPAVAAVPPESDAHALPCEPRGVPLGLRFKVLHRDKFKCTACGNSPAVDPACRLHVDHIEHWSRGGKTEPGNLRTLCAACNLGRGARAEG